MSTVSTTEATLCHSSGEVIGNWRDYAGGSRADNPRDRKPWLWSGTDGAGVKESSDYQCRLLLARSACVCGLFSKQTTDRGYETDTSGRGFAGTRGK